MRELQHFLNNVDMRIVILDVFVFFVLYTLSERYLMDFFATLEAALSECSNIERLSGSTNLNIPARRHSIVALSYHSRLKY